MRWEQEWTRHCSQLNQTFEFWKRSLIQVHFVGILTFETFISTSSLSRNRQWTQSSILPRTETTLYALVYASVYKTRKFLFLFPMHLKHPRMFTEPKIEFWNPSRISEIELMPIVKNLNVPISEHLQRKFHSKNIVRCVDFIEALEIGMLSFVYLRIRSSCRSQTMHTKKKNKLFSLSTYLTKEETIVNLMQNRNKENISLSGNSEPSFEYLHINNNNFIVT